MKRARTELLNRETELNEEKAAREEGARKIERMKKMLLHCKK